MSGLETIKSTQYDDGGVSEELMQRCFLDGIFRLSELAPVLTMHQTEEIPPAVRAFGMRYELSADLWGHNRGIMASIARFAALGVDLKTIDGNYTCITVNELLPFLAATDPKSKLASDTEIKELYTANRTKEIAQAILGTNAQDLSPDQLALNAGTKIREQDPIVRLRMVIDPLEWVRALQMKPSLEL